MKAIKGLEFLMVALPGVGHMPAKGEDEQEAGGMMRAAASSNLPPNASGQKSATKKSIAISEKT